jgi:hypothetical protein
MDVPTVRIGLANRQARSLDVICSRYGWSACAADGVVNDDNTAVLGDREDIDSQKCPSPRRRHEG